MATMGELVFGVRANEFAAQPVCIHQGKPPLPLADTSPGKNENTFPVVIDSLKSQQGRRNLFISATASKPPPVGFLNLWPKSGHQKKVVDSAPS